MLESVRGPGFRADIVRVRLVYSSLVGLVAMEWLYQAFVGPRSRPKQLDMPA